MRRLRVLPAFIGVLCASLVGCAPDYASGYSSTYGYAPQAPYVAEPAFAPELGYAPQPMFVPPNGFYAEREYRGGDRYRDDRYGGWRGEQQSNDWQQRRNNFEPLRQQRDYNRNLLAEQQQHNAVVVKQQQYNQALVAQQNAYNQALLAQQRAAQGR